MISPGQIAFDIDGVFANTMGLFLEIARKDYGINHIKYEDITQYFLEECLDVKPEIINIIINGIGLTSGNKTAISGKIIVLK